MLSDPSLPVQSANGIPQRLRERVAPSLTAWMDWLCPQIDDAMLEEIAAADYGYRMDEYLAALRPIRDEYCLPDQLAQVPLEVLQLIRSSEPDDPAWMPGRQGRRGHLMRLFCCAILIVAAGDPEVRRYVDDASTLHRLVGSAVALGEAAVAAILPLLCARVPGLPATDAERPFFALSILLLAATRYRQESDGPLLRDLCQWTIAEEARCRAAQYPSLTYEVWLLGLTFSADGDDVWRDLAWRLLIEPAAPHPPAAEAALRDIGALLVLGELDGSDATA